MVLVDLNFSRESGELTEEEEMSVNDDTPEPNFSFYVARSLAERMVLDHPLAPILKKLNPLPVSSATMITDRVGRNLTVKDRS